MSSTEFEGHPCPVCQENQAFIKHSLLILSGNRSEGRAPNTKFKCSTLLPLLAEWGTAPLPVLLYLFILTFRGRLQIALQLRKCRQEQDTHMSPCMVLAAPPWMYPGFRAWIWARKAFSDVGDGTRPSNCVLANSESTVLSVSLATSSGQWKTQRVTP